MDGLTRGHCCLVSRVRDRVEDPIVNGRAITFIKHRHCPWGIGNKKQAAVVRVPDEVEGKRCKVLEQTLPLAQLVMPRFGPSPDFREL